MVKSILFKMDIEGNGVVNYDSNEQRYFIGQMFPNLYTRHDNVMFAKRNIYDDGENPYYRLVISPTCLKHAMFQKVSQTPRITHNKDLLYMNLAHPETILNGHMHVERKEQIERKGAVTMIAAEQTCDALSRLEFFSKSGEKITYEAEDGRSDNSIYKKETVGDIKYATQGAINLKELQFYSCDGIMGRYGLNPDNFEIFKKYAQIHFGEFDNKMGWFQMRGSSVNIAERGFKFTDAQVRHLVAVFIEKLLTLNVERSNAYARREKLMVKLVSNPLTDRFNSEDGWIEINSLEDIKSLEYDIYEAYVEDATGEPEKLRADLEKYYEDEMAAAREANKQNKAAAQQKKDQKKAEKVTA